MELKQINSIICLIHFTIKYLSNDKLIKPLFLISSLFWFYPYIHSRAASENLSIIFLIFAITLFSFFRNNPSEQIADPEYIIFVTRSGSKTLIKAEAVSGSLEDAEDLISVLNESLS